MDGDDAGPEERHVDRETQPCKRERTAKEDGAEHEQQRPEDEDDRDFAAPARLGAPGVSALVDLRAEPSQTLDASDHWGAEGGDGGRLRARRTSAGCWPLAPDDE